MTEVDRIESGLKEVATSLDQFHACYEQMIQLVNSMTTQMEFLTQAASSSGLVSQELVLQMTKNIATSTLARTLKHAQAIGVPTTRSLIPSKPFSRLPIELVEFIILAVKDLHGITPIERWDNLRSCASVCILWHDIAAPLHLRQLHLRTLKDLGRVYDKVAYKSQLEVPYHLAAKEVTEFYFESEELMGDLDSRDYIFLVAPMIKKLTFIEHFSFVDTRQDLRQVELWEGVFSPDSTISAICGLLLEDLTSLVYSVAASRNHLAKFLSCGLKLKSLVMENIVITGIAPTVGNSMRTLTRLWIPYQQLSVEDFITVTSNLPRLTSLAFTFDLENKTEHYIEDNSKIDVRLNKFIDHLKKLAPILEEFSISSLYSDAGVSVDSNPNSDNKDPHFRNFFDNIILSIEFPSLHTLTLSGSRWTELILDPLFS